MLDDFPVLKRPFRTCPSKTTSYLRACLFHQFTWTFLVAFSNDALSSLHHIFVRTSFIGTGAIPFKIHPPRFGWHFPRGIWKLFQRRRGRGGGGGGNLWSLKTEKKLGYFWRGNCVGTYGLFCLGGEESTCRIQSGGGGRGDGMAWGQPHTETNGGRHPVAQGRQPSH